MKIQKQQKCYENMIFKILFWNQENYGELIFGILLNDRERKEIKRLIRKALKSLTKRETEILISHFGLIDGEMKVLTEIAQIYNLSVQRIYQIEAKACRKLMHPLRSGKLRKMIDAARSRAESAKIISLEYL